MSATPRVTLQETARRSRVRGVRAALVTALVVAGAAYALAGDRAAEGVLLGGIAGALGFWTMSLRLERIVLVRPDKLHIAAVAWTFYRLLMYAVFLFAAFRLDRVEMRGLFGAVAGLFSTRFAITLVGIRDARARAREESAS